MKNIKLFILAGIVLQLLAVSCTKEGPPGPAGPQGSTGPNLTGNLSGYIWLYDQYGTRLFTNLANIRVSIDNSSLVSMTNASGKYVFNNLTTGNYNITITDTLYGPNKIQNLQFVGGGDINRDVKLSQIPTFSMSTCTAIDTTVLGVNYVKVKGTITADPRNRNMVVFAGNSASVSSAPANYVLTYSRQIAANATSFNFLIPASDLYGAGMPSASTVYFAAYSAAMNFNTTSTYEDFSTGKIVYTAIGPTPIAFSAPVP